VVNLGRDLTCAFAFALLAACRPIGGDAPWEPPPYWTAESTTLVDGRRIAYLEAGRGHGEAMVFVHGWSGNVQNFWDEFDHFSATHHVLVIDAPGMGKSERGEHVDMGNEAYVRTIVAVMDEVGMSRAHVVANSVGGNIAARLAIAHPDRVESLVLSNPTGSGRDGKITWVKNTVTARALFVGGLTTWLNYPNPDLKSVERQRFLDSFHGTVEERPYLRALADALASGYEKIPAHELERLTMPVMLIYTSDDPVVPPRAIEYFVEHLPHAKRHTIYRGGHVPMMRTPQEFICVVEAFVTDAAASTSHCLPDEVERARRDRADHKKRRTSERHPIPPAP
jgi:pimeloyl-ACP methyl ester carboxylesterase